MLKNLIVFQNLTKKFLSTKKYLFFIGFLIIFIFQIWSTSHTKGVATTNDSLEYLQTAQNLVLHYDFIQTNSQPYIAWALGFPFLLILFKDSIFLNLICILGSYIFYFDLIQKLFQKKITKWWLVLAFVFSTPLYLIHHFVWSEPPFLFSLMALIWSFYYFSYSNNNQKLAVVGVSTNDNLIKYSISAVVGVSTNDNLIKYSIYLFYLFGFLFTSMRNAGLYFVIGINSGIILFYILPFYFTSTPKNIKLLYQNSYFKPLVYFSFSSLFPIFLWWLHAKIKTEGNFDTIYNLALRTFSEECLNYGDILSRWIFPPSIPLEIRIFLLIIFIVFLLFVGTRVIINHFSQINRCLCPHERLMHQNTNFILFIFWITFVYLMGMLLSRAGMKIDAERFLAILYPFLCILIAFVLDKIKVNDSLKYGIAFLGLIYPLLRTLKNIIFWN